MNLSLYVASEGSLMLYAMAAIIILPCAVIACLVAGMSLASQWYQERAFRLADESSTRLELAAIDSAAAKCFLDATWRPEAAVELMDKWSQLKAISKLGQEPKAPKRNLALGYAKRHSAVESGYAS